MSDRKIIVYSAAERRYCEPLLAAYRERHPQDELEFVDGISTPLDRRFREEIEAGRRSADVVWSTAMDLQVALVRDGLAAECFPPNAAALEASSNYANRAYATTREPLVTLVDTRAIGEAHAGSLREIAELVLADVERFRGRVAGFDIAANGLGFLGLLFESRLRPGFDRYLDVLSRVEPQVLPSNPAMVDALASGRAVLAPHVLGAYADRFAAMHAHLSIARSAEPAIAVSRVAVVSSHARNPDGAVRFVDFLLSEQGQERLGEAGFHPLRSPRHALSRPVAPVPLDASFDALLDPAIRNEFLARWRAATRTARTHDKEAST